MAATPQESTRPTGATTHTPTASTGSAASKVECVLTGTSDGKWTRDGKCFNPLELYAVVRQGGDDDLDFFDFLDGGLARRCLAIYRYT